MAAVWKLKGRSEMCMQNSPPGEDSRTETRRELRRLPVAACQGEETWTWACCEWIGSEAVRGCQKVSTDVSDDGSIKAVQTNDISSTSALYGDG